MDDADAIMLLEERVFDDVFDDWTFVQRSEIVRLPI
jgi:hypothetical protein